MTKRTIDLQEDSLAFADLLEMTADIEGSIGSLEEEVKMTIEEVKMSLPIQLDFGQDEEGKLLLGGIPLEHYVATSVQSVFHQMTLTLVPIPEGSE